jgi:3-deoxy-7-phosphoheptulonate synthase
VKEMSDLPVIVDPSHATGKRSLISAASKAAVAIGADGLIIEVHPDPDAAWSDSAQSIDLEMFGEVMENLASPLRSVRNAGTAEYAIR